MDMSLALIKAAAYTIASGRHMSVSKFRQQLSHCHTKFDPLYVMPAAGGGGGGGGSGDVYINPNIWKDLALHVSCSAPCDSTLPITVLPSLTTIT